jgi:hypothetical protein
VTNQLEAALYFEGRAEREQRPEEKARLLPGVSLVGDGGRQAVHSRHPEAAGGGIGDSTFL